MSFNTIQIVANGGMEGSRMILIISWSEIDPPCWCAFTGAVLLYIFKMLYSKVNCVLNVIVFNRMIKMLFLFIYLIDCFLYTSDIQEFLLFYLMNLRKCLTLRSMTALWSHGKLVRVPIILSRFMSSKKQKYFFWLFYLSEGYPRYGNYFYREASELFFCLQH